MDDEIQPKVVFTLSDEDIDRIAEKAAEKAVQIIKDDFYRDVGKTTINKFLWLVGAITIAVGVYMQQKGWMK
jgi:hypothetical protein